ncbi:hypothetical protein V8C86DRAFT_3137925 [Haematococcus lacustris]
MCNHCQDNLAVSNKDRLKRHLLRCSKFLASTQAMNIAKTFSEIAAAIEDYKQENKEIAELQQDAGTTPNSKSTARAGSGVVEDKGRFAKDLVKLIVDCNLPFNIVDNPTFKAFLATWVPAMPVPSRDQTGKICGLVTDTPSSMQKLWCLVEAAMPKVLAMGCWAHILNLFFTVRVI